MSSFCHKHLDGDNIGSDLVVLRGSTNTMLTNPSQSAKSCRANCESFAGLRRGASHLLVRYIDGVRCGSSLLECSQKSFPAAANCPVRRKRQSDVESRSYGCISGL